MAAARNPSWLELSARHEGHVAKKMETMRMSPPQRTHKIAKRVVTWDIPSIIACACAVFYSHSSQSFTTVRSFHCFVFTQPRHVLRGSDYVHTTLLLHHTSPNPSPLKSKWHISQYLKKKKKSQYLLRYNKLWIVNNYSIFWRVTCQPWISLIKFFTF